MQLPLRRALPSPRPLTGRAPFFPQNQVSRVVFAHLGLEYDAALKASSEAYVAKSKEDRKKKAKRHTYSIEEYGLTQADVDAAFARATA